MKEKKTKKNHLSSVSQHAAFHRNLVQNCRQRTKLKIWLQHYGDRVHHLLHLDNPVVRIAVHVAINARSQRRTTDLIDANDPRGEKDPRDVKNLRNVAPIAAKRIKNDHNAKAQPTRRRFDRAIVKRRRPNENHDLVLSLSPNRLIAPNFNHPSIRSAVSLPKSPGINCKKVQTWRIIKFDFELSTINIV